MNTKKRQANTLRDITNISSQASRNKIRKVTSVTTRPSYVRPFWTEDSKANEYSSYLPQLKSNDEAERTAFQYCDKSYVRVRCAKKKDKNELRKVEEVQQEMEEENDKDKKSKENHNNHKNKSRKKNRSKNKKRKKKKSPQDPTSGLWFLRKAYLHSDKTKDDLE